MTQGTAAARLRPEPAPSAAPPAAPATAAAEPVPPVQPEPVPEPVPLETAGSKETSAPLTLPLKSLAKDPSAQETSNSKLATALFNGPGSKNERNVFFFRGSLRQCRFEKFARILSK